MCVTLMVLTGVWAGAQERASETRRDPWEEVIEGLERAGKEQAIDRQDWAVYNLDGNDNNIGKG